MDSLVDKKTVVGPYIVTTLYLGSGKWMTYVMGPHGIDYRPAVYGEEVARDERDSLIARLSKAVRK